MSGAARRPWVSLPIVLAGVVTPWRLGGPPAPVAGPPAPVVTFTSDGAPPITCGTQPDVGSLAVPEGTAIVLANSTGVRASVVVGGGTVLTVFDGEGASLVLAPGQHEVSLVPERVKVTLARSLVVTVASAPPISGAPSTLPGPAPGGQSVPGSSADGDPVATDAPVDASVTRWPEVLRARPVELREAGTPKGVRLLAAIATICVLGVTAAIIRSIVRLDA